MQDFINVSTTAFQAMTDRDKEWMSLALEHAANARELDEVPVGACVVGATGELLAAASNLTITNNDPTAHAEVVALRAASEAVGNYRLVGVTVYSTIEPCAMCAGALVNARIKRLVYGADDERFGAVKTHFGIGITDVLNHRIDVVGGVMAEQCRAMIQEFFRARRRKLDNAGTSN
jgi:tRNA(adenine34) deaminase